MAGGAKMFQVKLSGNWQNYNSDEDKILKRAYLAGFPNAKYTLRGNGYVINFKDMQQLNTKTGKSRLIRAPHKWKPPSAPLVAAGKTFVVKVPPGGPGSIIQVPHPDKKNFKGQFVAVNVPASAKPGQSMLVPIPQGASATVTSVEPSAAEAAEVAKLSGEEQKDKKAGWSTGAKVAAGGAGIVAVGGLAVGGAILGEHIAEEGWDATMADLGDIAGDAGEAAGAAGEDAGAAIADGAEAAGEWAEGAGETVGDFIMDLF